VDVGVVEVRGEVADGDGGPEARLDLPLQRPRHHPGPGGGEGTFLKKMSAPSTVWYRYAWGGLLKNAICHHAIQNRRWFRCPKSFPRLENSEGRTSLDDRREVQSLAAKNSRGVVRLENLTPSAFRKSWSARSGKPTRQGAQDGGRTGAGRARGPPSRPLRRDRRAENRETPGGGYHDSLLTPGE